MQVKISPTNFLSDHPRNTRLRGELEIAAGKNSIRN
jgi:hypothetical protein